MKLIRTLKVTKKEFYDFLEDDLLSNIYQCTQKKLSTNDIKKGLHYSKNDSDVHTRVDVTIVDYLRGEYYKSKIKSMEDTVSIVYRTKEVEDGLEVEFTQHISSFENKKHNKIMKGFSEAVYLSRMTDTLYDIQKKIINKKEGIIEKKPSQPIQHKHLKKLLSKD